ncbi:MAG: tetratricopeptide (TPR) repeat protein [Flammeovirgaceae bacterium]|jgi:tetratricopeptide (TPR) repeat protein
MKIDSYFERLKHEKSQSGIGQVIDKIWQLWLWSGDSEIDYLMETGCSLISNKKYEGAISTFTEIIKKAPAYAEGWNKRATTYYLKGDYQEAIDDIQQTLAIEARHFGALSGLATIYLILNNHAGALDTFRKLYEIYPHRKNLKSKIDCLEGVINEQN